MYSLQSQIRAPKWMGLRMQPVSGGSSGVPAKSGAGGSGRRQTSAFDSKPGRREMKEYPLTYTELIGLGVISVFSTIFFSIGTFLFSTYLDIKKDLAFSVDISGETRAYWMALETTSFWGAIIFIVLAGVTIIFNGIALKHIIDNTRH